MTSSNSNRKLLNEKFRKLFSKFSMKDLKEHILDLFDVSWSDLKKHATKYNLSFKMSDIARIFLEYTSRISFKEFENLYYNLLTLDLVLHNGRKKWSVISMKQPENPILVDEDSTAEIIREFKKDSMNVRMNSHLENDILWVVLVVIKSTKSREAKHSAPYFIARHVKYPYLFYSPKNLNKSIAQKLVSGYGYNGFKVCKLTGKSIPSLVKLLNGQRKAPTKRAETSLVLKNAVADCVRLSTGIDYCQDKIRAVHSKQMLGDETLKLDRFTVKAEAKWRGLRALPEAEDATVSMNLTIKSKNIRETIDTMITNGILTQPYPDWVKEFLISGRNVINIA